jgi:hypothetical protein
MKDCCSHLQQDLHQLEIRCQAMVTNLNKCDTHVRSYVHVRLAQKLCVLNSWVTSLAESLYREHKSQGYVTVLLRPNIGVEVMWVESEALVADRASWKTWGFTVVSVLEFGLLLSGVLGELTSGNWPKVVDWFNEYGKSPGLDLDQFLKHG